MKEADECVVIFDNDHHVLSFENLSFHVGNGKVDLGKKKSNQNTSKKIINNISGQVKRGQMVSVMGPSGAGKTTLLNILSLRATYGVSTGKLSLDGVPLNDELFKSKCFLVGQYEKNWPHLTVFETCSFAARLFGGTTEESEISKHIRDVINDVGLNKVCHNFNASLSGGQQRRLSLAVALLKKPVVLFLDEITSGLDSASADRVCKVLRRIVEETNVMVICTIHQPSTKIFLECFNQLILLSEGRLAYAGGTVSAESYFSELGYPVPAMTNPSEHYLELVNSDFGCKENVNKILTAWESKHCCDGSFDDADVEQQTLPNPNSLSIPKGVKSSLFSETRTMLRRHFIMTYRDPVLYLGRCVTALIMNCIFAIVYWNAREYHQDQVLSKSWLIGWFGSAPMIMGTVAVFSLNTELSVILNEQKNGMLRISSYIMAKLILTLPFIFLFAIFALGIPGWVLQDYPLSAWFSVTLLWSISAYLFESLAECLAIWVKNKVLGMLLYLSFWISSFLFSGLFLPLEDIMWPLTIFYYITPFSYYTRSMYYLLYSDASFDTCNVMTNPFEPICVENGKGSNVLDELSKILPLFENKDYVVKDIFVLLGIALFFKAFYIAGMVVRSREISSPSNTAKEVSMEANSLSRS